MVPWGTGGGGREYSEKYKHKYNYKILAWFLILSVMNYMRLFIKMETLSIRSPTASFSLSKVFNSLLVCDMEAFPPHLACKVILSKTVLTCAARRRITQMPPFPSCLASCFSQNIICSSVLTYQSGFVHHFASCNPCKIHVSITKILFIPLCTYFPE